MEIKKPANIIYGLEESRISGPPTRRFVKTRTARVYWRDFCCAAMPTVSAPNGKMATPVCFSISTIRRDGG
jgi:hypothetical protein